MKGEWVKCAHCGKLGFWSKKLYDFKVNNGYILLCSHECGLEYFKENPLHQKGVQDFMKIMSEV